MLEVLVVGVGVWCMLLAIVVAWSINRVPTAAFWTFVSVRALRPFVTAEPPGVESQAVAVGDVVSLWCCK